jgi:hypothetical protein
MSGSSTSSQTTLLTSHKGVDLHAATALVVMKDRLEGGHLLEGLFRCEIHTFWGDGGDMSIDRLLDIGRFFNPNKHHYGHFEMTAAGPAWFEGAPAGNRLNHEWPGAVRGTDLDIPDQEQAGLYDLLLGSAPSGGVSAVDVVSYPRGQEGPVLSGVLWRLVIRAEAELALEVGHKLAVARGRLEGLLANPHMESWLAAVR